MKKEAAESQDEAHRLYAEVVSTLEEMTEEHTPGQEAEREELRVRVHPRDIQSQERFLHLQARRLLLSIFASVTAVITSILFIALRNWWLLGTGLVRPSSCLSSCFSSLRTCSRIPCATRVGSTPDDAVYALIRA